jgi:hypothetical protein
MEESYNSHSGGDPSEIQHFVVVVVVVVDDNYGWVVGGVVTSTSL